MVTKTARTRQPTREMQRRCRRKRRAKMVRRLLYAVAVLLVAVAVVGEYVVSVFGAEDLVDTFMSHLNGIFGVQPVYDEAIQ